MIRSGCALTVWAGSASVAVGQAWFQGIGDLAGGQFWSDALAVSADGSVVVGTAYSGAGQEALRWSAPGGIQGLGPQPGGFFAAQLSGASADGAVVVGFGWTGSTFEAFRLEGGAILRLGFLPGSSESFAWKVSADGSTIVGYCHTPSVSTTGFRWTASSGMQPIGSELVGVSADGSVAVGRENVSGTNLALRWDNGSTTLLHPLLGQFPPHTFTTGSAVSGDGSVILGVSWSYALGAPPIIFRWVGPEVVPMGGITCTGCERAEALGASTDGSTVVGYCRPWGQSDDRAFVWTAQDGMRDLQERLTAGYGLSLAGWSLRSARGVSADGRTIVGWGINPGGDHEGWIAHLDGPVVPFCPPDCNRDGCLTVADFGCFQTRFVAGDPYADCNADGALTVADFGCFQTKFVAGCP